MSMLVRLIPPNPKTGHTYKTFTYAGIQFRAEGTEGAGTGQRWYSVSDEVANYLKNVRVDNDPQGALAFHVATIAEADAYEKDAGRTLDPRTTAEFERLGGDMRSADLGGARARVIAGRNDPEDRPGSASSLVRGPNEVHATDPTPEPTGQPAPNAASTLGTPANPIDAGGGKPDTTSQAPAKPSGRSR